MSTVPIVIKGISADPWVIGFGRLLLGAIGLYLLKGSARRFAHLRPKDWALLGTLGICFGLHWAAYFFSIKMGSPTIAVIATLSSASLFLSLAGSHFLGHRIRWIHWLGLIFGIVGTVLIGGEFEIGSNALTGFLLGILSGVLYGILPILHQKAPHLNGNLRSWGQFTGGLIVFAFFIPLGNWDLPLGDWLGILYLGTICTVGAHTLMVHAVSALPTTSSALLNYLYIPGTAILSYLLLDERLSLLQIVGAIIIITASMLGILADKFLKNEPSNIKP